MHRRAWWRRHGTAEWLPLSVTAIGNDYRLPYDCLATPGTNYAADLGGVVTAPGAIDVKIALVSGQNATSEIVYEPVLVVTEPQGRRRAVR